MTTQNNSKTLPLSLAALGIVYGDLGSSPLYAFRESFTGLSLGQSNIYGVLSLIFWSLILIVSLKYLIFILRVDNEGEGGVLALLALLKKQDFKAYKFFFVIAIVGTALLIGDGMLTPAISVISAVEGLNVIKPELSHLTIPITIVILLILFACQHYGTARIGGLFGPILLTWFIVIATLGAIQITENPVILNAINPLYAFEFFINNGFKGYLLLGSIFLVVTGGEALYADLGHFGRLPIRLSWFTVALPCLLLNYFGQGAYLIKHPAAIENPFYALAPSWFSYPLLILATLATIIASQAVISATFSLLKQAVMLDLYPRIRIVQTSEEEIGQVYVPHINFFLGLGSLLLVVIFQSSSALTHAYGIAVNMVMLSVTALITYYCYAHLNWSKLSIIVYAGVFITIDLAFFGANIFKIHSGGWFPLVIAFAFATVMITWHRGIEFLRKQFYKPKGDFKETVENLRSCNATIMPDSLSIFVSDPFDESGGALIQYLKINRMIPERVVILSITTENKPYIKLEKRFELTKVDQNICRLIIHNGFMQLTDLPDVLDHANKAGVFQEALKLNSATYLIEETNVVATRRKPTLSFYWQEKLFAFLMRNSEFEIEFYHIPISRSFVIGSYFEI